MNSALITLRDISKCYENNQILTELNLDIYAGELLTLLGPSGCGKTTLLRLISGFETPDTGTIYIKNKNVTHHLPTERNVNMVFQSYALFPHMTVFENVAFGLECKKLPKGIIADTVIKTLERVKLSQLMDRKPQQLSGGQQQRVAIARAIVMEPLVLLLDEPLSALDHNLRKNMRLELKALQRDLGITFILVTHDQEEALSLSDRIVVMNEGIIEQVGTPREIYEEPTNLYVAQFIGEVNIFKTLVKAQHEDKIIVNIDYTDFTLNNKRNFVTGQKLNIIIRPEDIEVWHQYEIDYEESMLRAEVVEVTYKGSTVDLIVKLSDGQKISATEFFDEDDEDLEYTIGESVLIRWKLGWEVVLADEKE
ncbi:MAG TPA: spermidine/putrescine ABC transporter ATP-binding protein PotA [Coxiellaceae bacterium]|nr:spermidine/putrescine ABC transporter ATP-binding protein PotA [Coxiellaceae bacterium]